MKWIERVRQKVDEKEESKLELAQEDCSRAIQLKKDKQFWFKKEEKLRSLHNIEIIYKPSLY